MNAVIANALDQITERTNLRTGLAHPNDLNAAKELFVRLRDAGEPLPENEIELYATEKGWLRRDAKKLAQWAARIGNGQIVRVNDGPWWPEDIIQQLAGRVE
jgi:hypothetical protein